MLLWIIFIAFILLLLALDLGVLNKEIHVPTTREAFVWTGLWAAVALAFSGVVYYLYSHEWGARDLSATDAVLKYLSGYLVELSLSMDNVFVIALIFAYFRIPQKFQHRVLFWGILGALFFRGVMIGLGVWLVEQFQWMMYLFGLLLLYSAYKMLTAGESVHLADNPIIKFVKRIFPVTKSIEGEQFFVKRRDFSGRRDVWVATPLLVALVIVESTDILFAFDSIPAILAITTDPFLVFSSNVFAILGLRSLYFVLAAMLDRFEYLKYSLAIILFFVAAKMLLHDFWHPAEWVSLAVIGVTLGAGVVYSLSRGEEKA
jgi:tellurite resistance protein TerC